MDLKTAVEEYVYRKRLTGRRYENNCKELHAFARIYPLALNEIRVAHVSGFLNRSLLARTTWIGRYSRLRTFFNYWMAKHEIIRSPMPRPRRAGNRIFCPHIYSRSDISKILRSAAAQEHNLCIVSAETLSAFVIFMYATGVGLGEALALKNEDLNLQNATLTLSARQGPPRTIPICADLVELLRKYVQSGRHIGGHVFGTKTGEPIKAHRIKVLFRRARRRAGIRRTDGVAYPPSFRDLRHTFAVHRIMDWYEKGLNVEMMLPKLAAYLGLWKHEIVNRYLSLVPAHFKQQVKRLANDSKVKKKKRHSNAGAD
jgi:integrase/recombinase XerD